MVIEVDRAGDGSVHKINSLFLFLFFSHCIYGSVIFLYSFHCISVLQVPRERTNLFVALCAWTTFIEVGTELKHRAPIRKNLRPSAMRCERTSKILISALVASAGMSSIVSNYYILFFT